MARERPSFRVDMQYPHQRGHSSIWSEYGCYRSFRHAGRKAVRLDKPCRIVVFRVIWRSVPIR